MKVKAKNSGEKTKKEIVEEKVKSSEATDIKTVMVQTVTPDGTVLDVPVKIGMVNGKPVVIAEKLGAKKDITVTACAEALKKNKGYITYAARELGISHTTLRENWVDKHPELQEIIDEEREMDLDRAEKNLGGLADDNKSFSHLGAICFTLKTRGKKRGYIETNRVEVGGSGTPVQINLVDFKESDIMPKEAKK